MCQHLKSRVIENNLSFNKIVLEITTKSKNIKLVTLYRPPNPSNYNDFLNEIEKSCEVYKEFLLVGDFNTDILSLTSACKNFKNLLNSYKCEFLNTASPSFATRTTTTTATIIDHMITNLSSKYFEEPIKIIETHLSDHKVLMLRMTVKVEKNPTFVLKDLCKFDKSKFIKLTETYLNSITNHKLSDLLEILIRASSTLIVTKKVRENCCSWMTLKILDLMKQRDKIYLKRNKNLNWQPEYKNVCFQIKSEIKKTKKISFESDLQNATDNLKLWLAINKEISCSKQKTTTIDEILTDEGDCATNDGEIANCFNEFFLKHAENLRFGNDVERVRNQRNANTIFLDPITKNEIQNDIHKLKAKSSPGYDGITSNDLN